MKTQSAALHLADALDSEFTTGRISNDTGRKAAAELRRLHAVNDELLGALKAITALYETDEGCRSLPEYIAARAAIGKGLMTEKALEMADDAIAKATGQEERHEQ